MSSGQFFYYYTDSVEAVQILNERILRSVGGVRLSILPPEDHTRNEVLYSTHGNIISTKSHGYIVVVNGSALDFSKLHHFEPNEFRYYGSIDISNERGGSSPSSSSISASYSNTSGSSGSVASQPPIIYFYYSNERIATQIRTEGHTARNILLTSMKPKHFSKEEILETLYGNNFDKTWVDWYLKIDARKLVESKIKWLGPVVFEYAAAIVVNPIDVMKWGTNRQYALDQKLCALSRKKAGESTKKISEEMGIPFGTIKNWLRSKNKIKSTATQIENEARFKNSMLSSPWPSRNYNDHPPPMQSAATGFSNEVQTFTPIPHSTNSMLSSQWPSRNYNDHPPLMQSVATGFSNEVQSPTLTPTPHSMNSILSSQWPSGNYNDHPPPMQSAAKQLEDEVQSPTLNPTTQSIEPMLSPTFPMLSYASDSDDIIIVDSTR